MTKLGLTLILSFLTFSIHAKEVYLTIGSDAVQSSKKSILSLTKLKSESEISIIKIDEKDIENLSHHMHENFNRCGGFIFHNSLEEAIAVLEGEDQRTFAKNADFIDYTITKRNTVKKLINQVDEFQIRSSIIKLSSFHNRYYKSETGVKSQAWIKSKWEQLSKNRTDAKVEYYRHSAWPQPSVVMTIEGTSKSNEIVIIGGHADSIAGFWGREKARAPGADDNASGIATITEVIRIITKNGIKPAKTIKFMAYAAEEVGLKGSKEIADSYRRENKNVVGVMQLDMTNHKGTRDLDIVFMSDFTNRAQNAFLGRLIDEYVHVPWGYSKCGYGCSDHASWHNRGYPASIPFESTMKDINDHIHTKRDLIDVPGSHGTADHAEKFAKLAIAFLIELGK